MVVADIWKRVTKWIINWQKCLLSSYTVAVPWVWGTQLHVTGDISHCIFPPPPFFPSSSQKRFSKFGSFCFSVDRLIISGWLHCNWCCLAFKRLNYPLSHKQLSLCLGCHTLKFSVWAEVWIYIYREGCFIALYIVLYPHRRNCTGTTVLTLEVLLL